MTETASIIEIEKITQYVIMAKQIPFWWRLINEKPFTRKLSSQQTRGISISATFNYIYIWQNIKHIRLLFIPAQTKRLTNYVII